MARLMRNFIGSIGGMASRVSGGEAEDSEADKHTRLKESPVESKLSVSSEEDGDEYLAAADSEPPQMKGSLCKWTNYLHGWQERHFVVENCMLAYYKSEADTQYGCRGSIALCKVKIIVSPSLSGTLCRPARPVPCLLWRAIIITRVKL